MLQHAAQQRGKVASARSAHGSPRCIPQRHRQRRQRRPQQQQRSSGSSGGSMAAQRRRRPSCRSAPWDATKSSANVVPLVTLRRPRAWPQFSCRTTPGVSADGAGRGRGHLSVIKGAISRRSQGAHMAAAGTAHALLACRDRRQAASHLSGSGWTAPAHPPVWAGQAAASRRAAR